MKCVIYHNGKVVSVSICPVFSFCISISICPLYGRLPHYLRIPPHLSVVTAFSLRANQALSSSIGILPPGYTLLFLQCHLVHHREQSRINCSFSLCVCLTQIVLFTSIVLNGFQWNLMLGSCHYCITPAEVKLHRFSWNSLSCKNLVHDVKYRSHCL
jgi:hypothetical protein